MSRHAVLLVAALLLLGGCGGGGAKDPSASRVPETPPLDEGPRAGDFPVVPALAAKGKAVFRSKGCLACHAFGKRVSGPDLRGVTRRRTAAWMESQILHPERMLRDDPITRALFKEYRLQMTNQGLAPDDAKSVIEYLKALDAEADAKGELPIAK